eukprot:6487915-Amphidinium_carterae.1
MSKTSVPTDSAMAEKVWEQTVREVGMGWLSGPFTFDQVSDELKGNFILSRRFGIEQGAVKKLRLIDDLSESGVNRAFSYRNKIRLGSVDEIAAVAKVMILPFVLHKSFRLVAADGSEHVVKIHPAWFALHRAGNLRLQGKTLDLQSAYKQLGVRKDSLWAGAVALEPPAGQCDEC